MSGRRSVVWWQMAARLSSWVVCWRLAWSDWFMDGTLTDWLTDWLIVGQIGWFVWIWTFSPSSSGPGLAGFFFSPWPNIVCTNWIHVRSFADSSSFTSVNYATNLPPFLNRQSDAKLYLTEVSTGSGCYFWKGERLLTCRQNLHQGYRSNSCSTLSIPRLWVQSWSSIKLNSAGVKRSSDLPKRQQA